MPQGQGGVLRATGCHLQQRLQGWLIGGHHQIDQRVAQNGQALPPRQLRQALIGIEHQPTPGDRGRTFPHLLHDQAIGPIGRGAGINPAHLPWLDAAGLQHQGIHLASGDRLQGRLQIFHLALKLFNGVGHGLLR